MAERRFRCSRQKRRIIFAEKNVPLPKKLQQITEMEITGKIIAVLPAQGGVSKTGNEWKKQEYILETYDQFPRKVCFQIFGNDKIEQAAIQAGEDLTIHFDIDSREYNGRWYTNISAWKVDRNNQGAPASAPPESSDPFNVPVSAATPPDFPAPSQTDDLPF